ncbi:MAG TPA: hypothetical protein VMH23_00710 [Bacteroidota bacterium]|nr:hypothetical protein [Bacteroidota bacterium]
MRTLHQKNKLAGKGSAVRLHQAGCHSGSFERDPTLSCSVRMEKAIRGDAL